jgi:hypothetical protein
MRSARILSLFDRQIIMVYWIGAERDHCLYQYLGDEIALKMVMIMGFGFQCSGISKRQILKPDT